MQPDLLMPLYDYNHSCNLTVLQTAAQLNPAELEYESSPSHHNVLRLLAHMWGVESNFLAACRGEIFAFSRPSSLDELSQRWEALYSQQQAYLPTLSQTDLETVLAVTISRQVFHFPRWQMLTQALVHSIHHRGELSIILTGLGQPLPNLDIIVQFAEDSGQPWSWK
jgi:uncharacterized damage-inducible protein DinB